MRDRSFDPTDLAAGVVFTVLGLAFGVSTLGLERGTALRMGPGYAPLVLAAVLTLLGVLIVVAGLRSRGVEGIGPLAWRGMAFLLSAPILFGLTVRGLGFVPAIFLATLLASLASPRLKSWQVLGLAVAITLFSTLVFSYALGLPFRRFGPWLSF
ncbi:tripartite tricarboxylate transporter TctB family protein [Rubellimicrobium rubrum]|uniref:Tripartite tricarboxylate transporter TctB family protein n=1 Tax=Rubellimicrobium rubrum TaxID=2585369 RepID=A0A5C4MR49_9RHOB|nr:tripartite tricarboxylate transporter TctB family protein [Rubellimicrobium rubrum]TNC46929.1 tripartite tricarboxylate transporter TctB family protein [Rubellimicrobium rubrum]